MPTRSSTRTFETKDAALLAASEAYLNGGNRLINHDALGRGRLVTVGYANGKTVTFTW